MKRRWERHFPETEMVKGAALILFGVCIALPLLFFWPQGFMDDVFDSRLTFHSVLSTDDFLTCSGEYRDFVVDEPATDTALHSFYVWNVTNAADVIQRGNKPEVTETGPYAYQKLAYKYDVEFNETDDSTVTYKEFSRLVLVEDGKTCTDMYYRLGRDELQLDDPCEGGACECESDEANVVIVNPLYMKAVWQETPFDLLGRFSKEIYETIRGIIEDEFPTAARAHMVTNSLEEVYIFRRNVMFGKILSTGTDSLLANSNLTYVAYLLETEEGLQDLPSTCGLGVYGISICSPLSSYNTLLKWKSQNEQANPGFNSSDYPSIEPLLDAANGFSYVNLTHGMPRWLGIADCFGDVEIKSGEGFLMTNRSDCEALFTTIARELAVDWFQTDEPTAMQLTGSEAVVRGVSQKLGTNLEIYEDNTLDLVYDEFANSSSPVECSPQRFMCVWQWGYMRDVLGSEEVISADMAKQMINFFQKLPTNPLQIYYEGNAAAWYNTYTYCNADFLYDSCNSLNYTFNDALRTRPAALWGFNNGVSIANLTTLTEAFDLISDSEKERYQAFACSVANLIYDIYPTTAPFHDEFTVKYLNTFKDPAFSHNFTVGKWTELGWAQFGGGFVTHALLRVRTVHQIIRDGMWSIGTQEYIDGLIEYSSWALFQAFPNAFIYDVYGARDVLREMAAPHDRGADFRSFIAYTGSTFIGDGVNYENGVGDVGVFTYTDEANLGNFSCGGEAAGACAALNNFHTATYETTCSQTQDVYDLCRDQIFRQSFWVTNCETFETALTDPSNGIPCDVNTVYGETYPYTKSRGNVLYFMLSEMTNSFVMTNGLYCGNIETCAFTDGGLFKLTTVKKFLFEGFNDPALLKYYNLKFAQSNISFECVEDAFETCGEQKYVCSDAGVYLTLPGGSRKLLQYENTSLDEFFAPYFDITADGELLWIHSSNDTVRNYSRTIYKQVNTTRVPNIHFAAFPHWNGADEGFQQYYQCQNRVLFGRLGAFTSCEDTLRTGQSHYEETFEIVRFRGNESLDHFGNPLEVTGSAERNQFPMYLWSAFNSYPYAYFEGGGNYTAQDTLQMFDKQYAMRFDISQDDLFAQEQDVGLKFPIRDTFMVYNFSTVGSLQSRRFTETQDTWDTMTSLGSNNDSYGMPYNTPVGMVQLTDLTEFPVFVGTAHAYGNLAWGGTAHADVVGYEPNEYSHRIYADYDPITGKGGRQAHRQQTHLRLERSAIFPNVISSLGRCAVPTTSYAGSDGFGCYAYVPLFWTESSRLMDTGTFVRLSNHYYARPARAASLTYIGLAIGLFFILLGTCIYCGEQEKKRKFMKRVYID